MESKNTLTENFILWAGTWNFCRLFVKEAKLAFQMKCHRIADWVIRNYKEKERLSVCTYSQDKRDTVERLYARESGKY